MEYWFLLGNILEMTVLHQIENSLEMTVLHQTKKSICIKNAKIREINYLSDNNVQILQSGISAAKPDPFSGFNPILDPIFF